jgi:hypothetical protein
LNQTALAMPPKNNPLNLNPLQLKTLTLLQHLAKSPGFNAPGQGEGGILVPTHLHAHGNHMHVGDAVVMTADATGMGNPAVFTALERKGLVRAAQQPGAVELTGDGIAYETGLADKILHRSHH